MRALILSLLLIGEPAAATPPQALTANGWGDLRIGMREAAAVRRFQLKNQDPEGEVTGPECREYLMPANPQLAVMTQDGRVSRISLHAKGRIGTDRGLGVGATEAQVRKAYGAGLRAEPHHYEGLPARYLTWWATPKTRGIRYETNVRRVVTAIHAGDASIQLIEGCL
jgi:hypothetical protein